MTWQDVLAAIREGKQTIPAASNGIPLVAINAPFYELMELIEAITTGYNSLVLRDADNQKKIGRIRKLAEAHFPASHKNTYNWVRVADRLPDKSGDYYTWGNNLGVYAMSYSAKHKMFNAHDSATEEEAKGTAVLVKYWCEKPNAPIDVPEVF